MEIIICVGALLILITFLVLWLTTKKIGLYSEELYYKIVFYSIVSVLIKLATIAVSFFFAEGNTTVISIFSAVSMFGLCFVLYYLFLLIATTFLTVKENKDFSFPYAALPLLEAVIIVFSSNKVVIDEFGVRYNNLGNGLLIAFIITHLLFTIGCSILWKKRISSRELKIIIASCVLWVFAIILQFPLEIAGTIDLCLALQAVVFFIYLENPLKTRDNEYKCFKNNSLYPCLDELFDERTPAFLVCIGFVFLGTNNQIESALYEYRKRIIKEYNTVEGVKTFVTSDGNIFAVSKDVEIYDDFIKDTKEMLVEVQDGLEDAKSVKMGVCSCPNILFLNDTVTLLRYISINLSENTPYVGYISYSEVNKNTIDSVLKEEEIKDKIIWALDNDKLEVFYQPIFSSKKNAFTTAEAYARIRNDDGTVMLPGVFIPIAEKKGLINQIGDRVFEKVCEFLSTPGFDSNDIEYISINISVSQCEDQGLADRFIKYIQKYCVSASLIELEIGEAEFMNSNDNLRQNIRKFARNGFKIALDSYGGDSSSFNSLIEYPITCVKLNMHLVWDYFESSRSKLLTSAIIETAHNLGLEVVAEGVETLSQLTEMSKQGADFIQGYYFFIPMDVMRFKEFLRPNAFEVRIDVASASEKIRHLGGK